jgi:hypothetical protein
MGVVDFFLAVASVIVGNALTLLAVVGNALTLLAVYMFWAARKLEQKGHSANNLPVSVLIAGIIPGAIVIWAALLLE